MAKKRTDELLSDILNLLDDVIQENKKAAKNAGVSNTPNMAILSYDAANMKVLGDSLKILSSAIVDIGKVSEKQITSAVKTIKQLGEAIQSIKITKEDAAGIMQMASTLVTLNGLFSQMTENFFKTYFTFSPLKARILGRRLAKFYKIIFKQLKALCFSDTIKVLKDIPDDKQFADRLLNFEKLVKIIRDIPMKDILKFWTMGLLIGEKTGRNIGKFFASIVDELTKNDPDGKKAEKAIGIAKSVTMLIGMLTLSLVIMVGLAFIDHKKLLLGVGLLVGLIATAYFMMKFLSRKKFQESAKGAKEGATAILMLLGGLTLSLVILVSIAKLFPIGSILLGFAMLVGLVAISWFMMKFLSKKKFKEQSKEALWGVAAIVLLFTGMSLAMMISIAVGKHAKEIAIGGIITLAFTAASILLFKWLSKGLEKSTIVKGLIATAGIVLMIAGISMAMMLYAEYLKKMDTITLEGVLTGVAITAAMILGVIGLAHIMSPLAFDPFFWIGFGMVETIALMIGSISYAMNLFADFVIKTSQLKEDDFNNAMKRISGDPGMVKTLREIVSALSGVTKESAFKIKIIGEGLKPVFESLSMFVDIIQKMAKMEILDHYDSKGKPVYRKMENREFTDAAKTVTDAFTYFLTELSSGLEKIQNADYLRHVIDLLFPAKKGGFLSFFSSQKRGIGDVIPVISQFVDIIIKFASMTVPTEWNSKGVPIKYRKVKNQEFTDAAKTVTDAFMTFLKEISSGLSEIENAPQLKYIIEQLFPSPKVVRTGLFRSKTVDQPGIGSVITAISSFMDIIIKMANAMIPDEWDKDGNPIHFKTIDSDSWIEAATTVSTCFSTFLKELSSELIKVKPLGLSAIRALSDTGIDKIAESIALIMQPIMQLAAGKIQVGDQLIELNVDKLNSTVDPIIDSFIKVLTSIKAKFNEDGWWDARQGADHAFYMAKDFSRSMAMIFSKEGRVAGGDSDGKDFLKIQDVTLEKIALIDPLINALYSIKLKFNEKGWRDARSGADDAFYMVSDFSQAMAMLFSEDGIVNGKASQGKQYLMLKNVNPANLNKFTMAKWAVLRLAEYINEHDFDTKKAKAFSEQMNYAQKGISTIQPLLKNTPAQMLSIAKSLRALDVELVEKQKQRTEAIQSVSNNFKDMAENIQKLNDTLAQSMSLMNSYNRMRLFSTNIMQQKGAQAIVNATEKVKDTVQNAVEHTKTLASNIGNKEDKKKENMKLFADIVSQAISTALDNWANQNRELVVKFDESPKAIFGNVEMG